MHAGREEAVAVRRDLARLASQDFDVLIVGGGISGACMAHDAALRGLSVALIEKQDFGGATSSASSKVLHGGIRYLQQGRLDKVRESVVERAAFQVIAPHLTRYVPFLIPTYRGLLRGRAALSAGIALYELVGLGQNRGIRDSAKQVPRSGGAASAEWLAELARLQPAGHPTGVRVLFESHMYNSERMTLAFVKTAAENGADVANYLAAEGVLRSGNRIQGVVARDRLTGQEIRVAARLTVNAAGPWIRGLNERFNVGSLVRQITGFSKGTHIVTRALLPDVGLALPTGRKAKAVVTRGGRHVFVIPWRGLSLIGTTDGPFSGNPDEVGPADEDIDDLLGDVNAALPGAGLTRADVRHAFAGLYPLTDAVLHRDVYQGTGDYQIVDHAHGDGVDGCMSVLGAKFTTARRLAERAIDVACRKLGHPSVPCRTRTTALTGGAIQDLDGYLSDARRRLPLLDGDVVAHLVRSYGTETDKVLRRSAPTRLAPGSPCVEAEVAFAVETEMAMRLDDVVFRRTGLGTVGHPGELALSRCAGIIGTRLGWSAERIADEVRQTARQFPVSPAS
jgi:glycerol-3-phosphate dehydrogenase